MTERSFYVLSIPYAEKTSRLHVTMVSLNIDRSLWKKVKHAAADREVTQTDIIEHLIQIDLDTCKHDKIK
jgi:hypothetical protein